MARLNVDLHVQVAHPETRETVAVQDEDDGRLRP
jgi:hypothetical protein